MTPHFANEETKAQKVFSWVPQGHSIQSKGQSKIHISNFQPHSFSSISCCFIFGFVLVSNPNNHTLLQVKQTQYIKMWSLISQRKLKSKENFLSYQIKFYITPNYLTSLFLKNYHTCLGS